MKKYSFRDVPQFTRSASYCVNIGWNYLEKHIEQELNSEFGAKLDLDPDFQRVHVWNEEKQRRYVEFILRGGHSSQDIYLNCAGWQGDFRGPYVLVDGKQRLEAVRKFLRGELTIFHNKLLGNKKPLSVNDFKDAPSITRASFRWNVNDLNTRVEVLQWYLDLNAGGVVHTDEEINKVKEMLKKEKKNA